MSVDTTLFTEGAIYYYENKSFTKKDYNNSELNQDFIVSRPVYILKQPKVSFETFTINVLLITSSENRCGIPITIDEYRNSLILPHAIHSVHRNYLTKYMGHVSDNIREEVSNAVKYYLGYSNELPQYVIDYEKRETILQERVRSMTVKEKVVYEFLMNKCKLDFTSYVRLEDMFASYVAYASENAYTRIQNFSKTMNKLISEFYPTVKMQSENGLRLYYGISVDGYSQPIQTQKDNRKKSTYDPNTRLDQYTNLELSKRITPQTMELYSNLDVIEKITLSRARYDEFDYPNLDTNDIPVLKQMIVNDVNIRRERVFEQLKRGESPFTFNTIDQYIIYVTPSEQLERVLPKRYLKNGGAKRIKSSIKKDVRMYFPKK